MRCHWSTYSKWVLFISWDISNSEKLIGWDIWYLSCHWSTYWKWVLFIVWDIWHGEAYWLRQFDTWAAIGPHIGNGYYSLAGIFDKENLIGRDGWSRKCQWLKPFKQTSLIVWDFLKRGLFVFFINKNRNGIERNIGYGQSFENGRMWLANTGIFVTENVIGWFI